MAGSPEFVGLGLAFHFKHVIIDLNCFFSIFFRVLAVVFILVTQDYKIDFPDMMSFTFLSRKNVDDMYLVSWAKGQHRS
jgi:hypothetical protein